MATSLNYQKEYYHKNRQKLIEKQKKYYYKNREKNRIKHLESNRIYRKKNIEKLRQYDLSRREKRKIIFRKKRIEWKEKGLCTKCGKERDTNFLRCSKCQEMLKRCRKNTSNYNLKVGINHYSQKYHFPILLEQHGCCQLCSKKEGLEIHHKEYTKDINSCLLLCRDCHSKIHRVYN